MALAIQKTSFAKGRLVSTFMLVLAMMVQPLVALNIPSAFAASIGVSPASQEINAGLTKESKIDASGYQNLSLSFDHVAEKLEDFSETGDSLVYGWRVKGGANIQLGIIEGKENANNMPGTGENGTKTHILPIEAAVSKLEIYFTNTGISTGNNDRVEINNIVVNGDLAPALTQELNFENFNTVDDNYEGISVGFNAKNFGIVDSVTVTLVREDNSTVTKHGAQGVFDLLSNKLEPTQATTPFVIQEGDFKEAEDKDVNGNLYWQPMEPVVWNETTIPKSVTVSITDTNGKTDTVTSTAFTQGAPSHPTYMSLLPPAQTPPTPSATEVIVTDESMNGWMKFAQTGGEVTFVTTAGANGTGALQLVTSSDNNSVAAFYRESNAQLNDLSLLGFKTQQLAGPLASANPSYYMAIDPNGDGNRSDEFYVLYETYYNGTNVANAWQTWVITQDEGKFWSSAPVGDLGSNGGGSYAKNFTLRQLQTAYPLARVMEYGLNMGTWNPSWKINVDDFNFNNTIYNFEPTAVVPEVNGENFNTHSGSDYEGLNVGFNIADFSSVTGVTVELFNGSTPMVANTHNQNLLDLINDDNTTQLSSPFITTPGTYTETHWNLGTYAWNISSPRPTSAVVTVVGTDNFGDTVTKKATLTGFAEPNGWTFASILPIPVSTGLPTPVIPAPNSNSNANSNSNPGETPATGQPQQIFTTPAVFFGGQDIFANQITPEANNENTEAERNTSDVLGESDEDSETSLTDTGEVLGLMDNKLFGLVSYKWIAILAALVAGWLLIAAVLRRRHAEEV